MAEDFLSQEEIDALLGGGKKETKVKKEIEPFDFSQIEKIKKGGLPGLELIFERWVKIFREEVRRYIPQVNMVSKDSIYVTRFNTFMSKIPLPSSYVVISMKPLKENALFIIDSRLVSVIISVLFGGPAKPFKVEGREFTKLELRVIEDFIDTALLTFEETWRSLYPVEVEKKSVELNPNLVKIVSSNEKVIVSECLVDIDGYEAPIFFCFPNGMFIPIKELIHSEFSSNENNPSWERELKRKVLHTEVKLYLELCRKELKIGDLLNLEIGDELELNASKNKDLTLYVDNAPKFICKLGKVKNRYAALIKEPIIEKEEEEE